MKTYYKANHGIRRIVEGTMRDFLMKLGIKSAEEFKPHNTYGRVVTGARAVLKVNGTSIAWATSNPTIVPSNELIPLGDGTTLWTKIQP